MYIAHVLINVIYKLIVNIIEWFQPTMLLKKMLICYKIMLPFKIFCFGQSDMHAFKY